MRALFVDLRGAVVPFVYPLRLCSTNVEKQTKNEPEHTGAEHLRRSLAAAPSTLAHAAASGKPPWLCFPATERGSFYTIYLAL